MLRDSEKSHLVSETQYSYFFNVHLLSLGQSEGKVRRGQKGRIGAIRVASRECKACFEK